VRAGAILACAFSALMIAESAARGRENLRENLLANAPHNKHKTSISCEAHHKQHADPVLG
jgi:hypothetical protein